MTETRTTDELRTALYRGDHVTRADFRAAEEREAAQFESTLADRRADRAARLVDPHYNEPADRSAELEQARVEREAETETEQTRGRIEEMRLARMDRRTPGGLPLTGRPGGDAA